MKVRSLHPYMRAFSQVLLFKQSLIPVVMSGIIAVYGLVVSVLIAGNRMYLFGLTLRHFFMLTFKSGLAQLIQTSLILSSPASST
jgi:hypothetical protein